jgi:predicted metal-dependent hydrolase
MYEKWLPFSLNLGVDSRQRILKRLQEVHSNWANWHLKEKRYPEAQRALRTAARFEVTLKVVAKLSIALIVPALARRILLQRESQRAGKQVLV